jgi:hypothetical protein
MATTGEAAKSSGFIPLWGRFEVVFSGPSEGNPFTEIDFRAIFRHGNRHVEVLGFYDGEGRYRLRFMPDMEGDWRFSTKSSSPALDGHEGSFVVGAPETGVRGPVGIGSAHHFAYADRSIYRPFGTTCYAWAHQGAELERRTLATLASSPFNKLRMCVFPKHYDFNENEPELHPFERASGGGFDAERFSPPFFRHLEALVAELSLLGIEADLILFHPYDRWGYADMGREADERYVRYVVARFAAYRNVWWSMANEYDLMPGKATVDWDFLFRVLQEADPHGHLRSIHNCMGFYDHGKPWITHCSVQHNEVSRVSEWLDLYRKPVVVDECKYEGDLPRQWGNITGREMAHRLWEAFARGSYAGHGETYLGPGDVVWWSKGGTLRGECLPRAAFLRRIAEEGPPAGLEPIRPGELGRDARAASKAGDGYFIAYFGMGQPSYEDLSLPAGREYSIDLIDGWNMEVTRAPGSYSGDCRVALPGRTHMAIRIAALR